MQDAVTITCPNGLVCFQDGLAELLQVCDVLAMNKIDDILNESKRQQSYPAINLKNFQIILRKFKSVFALLSPRLLPMLPFRGKLPPRGPNPPHGSMQRAPWLAGKNCQVCTIDIHVRKSMTCRLIVHLDS